MSDLHYAVLMIPSHAVRAARIDIGKTISICKAQLSVGVDQELYKAELSDALSRCLDGFAARQSQAVLPVGRMKTARDVVLYGFGRIGRILARILIQKAGNGTKLRLRAIVVRKPKKVSFSSLSLFVDHNN
jgi:glyceraldehyde 3-phosphate dehydrogenase